MKNNFSTTGKSDILITSPWGMGLMTYSQNSLSTLTMSPNGTIFKKSGLSFASFLKDKMLLNTKRNNMEIKADFDGDGKAELLMSGYSDGIAILKLIGGKFGAIAIAKNGTGLGGWIIDAAYDQFLYAADFDGDGKEELLVTNTFKGICILKYVNNGLRVLMAAPNGTRFGNWFFNTEDNNFTLTGDFDGDGKVEILVTSPLGLAILKVNGATLNSIVMVPNSTRMGDWTLDTENDKFEVVGDFNGDGKAEILVSNNSKIGILKLQGNSLTSICTANTGSRLGEWRLDSMRDKMSTVGDFDGDGKAEILFTSDWGLGILKLNGQVLQSSVMAANDTRFGGWRLNTRNNRLNYAADFDGDKRTEILVTSPWGIGILKQSGNSLIPIMMAPNDTLFGGWRLCTLDNDLEAGLGKSYGLIVYHEDWKDTALNMETFYKKRGYIRFVTSNANTGIRTLKRLALSLKACDRLFVFLGGHGGSERTLGDTSRDVALTHGIKFKEGSIKLSQIASSFQLMGNKGVDLIVFDGACNGGETVRYALGEKYLALSTTSIDAPNFTNEPNLPIVLEKFGKPTVFGMWWSECYSASLLTSITPRRPFQKIFRNDNTDMNLQSLFYKVSINFISSAINNGWYLGTENKCYLFRHIYPDEYNKLKQPDKDALTGSLNHYLAWLADRLPVHISKINALKSILNNANLINRAASVYTNAYPKPWRTIWGDMSWNVDTEPIRYTEKNNPIKPSSYKGTAGFVKMVNEIKNLLNLMEELYYKGIELLKIIDILILKNSKIKLDLKGVSTVKDVLKFQEDFKLQDASKLYDVSKLQDVKAQGSLEEAIKYNIEFNDYEQSINNHTVSMLKDIKIDWGNFYEDIGAPVESVQKWESVNSMLNSFLEVAKNPFVGGFSNDLVDRFISVYKSGGLVSASYLDKLYYLLTIVEESISHSQSVQEETGDLVKY